MPRYEREVPGAKITRRGFEKVVLAGAAFLVTRNARTAHSQEPEPYPMPETLDNVDPSLLTNNATVEAASARPNLPFVLYDIAIARDEPIRVPVAEVSRDGNPPPPQPKLEKYNAPGLFREADRSKPLIYLTIDDCWTPREVEQALDIAKSQKIRLTFFPVGRIIGNAPDLWARAVNEGHEIENHTRDHFTLTNLSDEQITYQINAHREAVANAIQREYKQNFLRPPGGGVDSRVVSVVNAAGLKVALWSSDSNGWRVSPRTDADAEAYILDNVFRNFFPGVIVLQHGNPNDMYALSTIADKAVQNGWKCISMNEGIS